MFRTSLANALVHRTCRPLYERHQATPASVMLDPTETGTIYSGMVATKSGANTVRICDGNADDAFGIFALDANTTINDLDGLSDNKVFSIWQGGPDAYFIVEGAAVDWNASAGYTLVDGENVPLYAGTSTSKGKITSDTPSGNAQAIAQLIDVPVAGQQLIIRVLAPAQTA